MQDKHTPQTTLQKLSPKGKRYPLSQKFSLRGHLHVFKEFTPRDLTYELRGQEKKKKKKKKKIKFKTNTHLRQPYKNYLQKGRGILNDYTVFVLFQPRFPPQLGQYACLHLFFFVFLQLQSHASCYKEEKDVDDCFRNGIASKTATTQRER